MSAPEELPSRITLPRLADFFAAAGLLTSLPLDAPDIRHSAFGRAAPLLPLVGALAGSVLASIDWLIAPYLPSVGSAALLVALWEIGSRGSLRRVDSQSTAFEVLVVLAKVTTLSVLPLPRLVPLLFAPLLGAWSIVVLAVGARDAEATGRKLAPGVHFNQFAVASLFTFAVVFGLADGLGILVVVLCAAATVGLRLWLHQSIGGVSACWLVRGSHIIETLTLALLMPFQS